MTPQRTTHRILHSESLRESIYKSTDEIKAAAMGSAVEAENPSARPSSVGCLTEPAVKRCFIIPLQSSQTRKCAARCPFGWAGLHPQGARTKSLHCRNVRDRFYSARPAFVFAQGAAQSRTPR